MFNFINFKHIVHVVFYKNKISLCRLDNGHWLPHMWVLSTGVPSTEYNHLHTAQETGLW